MHVKSAICRLAFGAIQKLLAIMDFIQVAIIAIQHQLVIDRKILVKMERHAPKALVNTPAIVQQDSLVGIVKKILMSV